MKYLYSKISPRFIRFLFSGGTATLSNLIILYCLTDFLHIYYITSAVLAMTISTFISFGLQKFWTFKDGDRSKIKWQLPTYILLCLFNLLLNTFLVFVFVEYIGLWYILAQIISSGLIAFITFFVFKYHIFKEQPEK
jgi:putative flippase GtrA